MATPEHQKGHVSLDAALSYHQRGMRVIPVKYRGKAPALEEWQNQELGEEEIRTHFKDTQKNVGVVTGEASDDLTVVDPDCPEAVRLAPHLLPRRSVTIRTLPRRLGAQWCAWVPSR